MVRSLQRIAASLLIASLALATGCGATGDAPSEKAGAAGSRPTPAGFSGSESCRECHERFYELWAPSRHGLAMQPFGAKLGEALTVQDETIVVGEHRYRAVVEGDAGWVIEQGPEGEKRYAIEHALGGKNVYYFLTPMERGRLQVLPIAFDVPEREWFDTAASALRHFPRGEEEVVHWRERPLTFNTSCYSCHVSQLSTNYDLETDTYRTVWAEPGINCETCHGPAGEHARVFREAPEGATPEDLRIIQTKHFTAEQNNHLCAPCHAKAMPLTASFQPGERYFDNYDLVALESRDFHPDGRDLGENYTYTTWLMSPCVSSGELDCLHCHTSSGRYRFAGGRTDEACLPCHRERVENASAHTHHPPESEGSRCVSCHMPKTSFARMMRHDHSMKPPTPAATLAFESPNACNLCHADRDAAWADRLVRQWRERDYQAPVLRRAALIDAARKQDWRQLPEMLERLTSNEEDAVWITSMIRLLRSCPDEDKWAAVLGLLDHRSPMVRAAAAESLEDRLDRPTIAALLAATRDDYRVVRIRAAAALGAVPLEMLQERDRRELTAAVAEFETAMRSRPDDHHGHYNLGNFYMARQEIERAIASYETAMRLEPSSLPPRINASIAYNLAGRNEAAERSLREALEIRPDSAEAHFNLGLLLAETGRMSEAEAALRASLRHDPGNAAAAYNLGVMVADDRIDEAVEWCEKAAELRPDEPRYVFTVAYYRRQSGDPAGAVEALETAIRRLPAEADLYLLLGEIHEDAGRLDAASSVYRHGMAAGGMPAQARHTLGARLRALEARRGTD
jgi:tetratricopeptide (TPR) repeat protein